jgi:hypothetical protein
MKTKVGEVQNQINTPLRKIKGCSGNRSVLYKKKKKKDKDDFEGNSNVQDR